MIALIDPSGSPICVGPRLWAGSLGENAEAEACDIFTGSARLSHDADTPRDQIATALSRVEQLALDKIYAGRGSAREAAHTRVVVLWAAMTIQVLLEQLASSAYPTASLERRLDRLLSLAASESIDPLLLADPASFAPEMQPARPSHEQRIVEQVFAHIRGHRRRPTQTASGNAREIILQPFQNRWAIFYEIAAGIAFTTFASAGSFVFLGVRLQKCTGLCKAGGITGFSSSLDIIALVICSFGFLFATLSYANATGVLARLSTMNYEEALERGNRVSEYFGVYPLVFAIPLAVEESTSSPIPLIVKVVGLMAFLGYHWSKRFALLERVIGDEALGSDRARKLTVLVCAGLLCLVWFGPGIDAGDGGLWVRVVASACFLIAICLIYGLASIVPEQASPSRFRVHRDDMINSESPSIYDLQPSRDAD